MNTIAKDGAQSGSAPFTFVLSDESVDRMGDVVMQSGISLQQFRKNPVALFAHQQRMPIGTWENIRRDGGQLLADLKLAARGTSRMIDELRSLIEQKILRAASIGFGVQKAEPLDPEKPYGGQRYTKTELLEASLVAVPANANALAVRSLTPELRALFFAEDGSGIAPHTRAAPAAHAAAPSHAVRTKGVHMDKQSIAEKIKAANERLGAIDARVKELQTVAETVDELTDAQADEVKALGDERAAVEKNLANLAALEKLIGERAQPVVGAPAVIRARGASPKDEPPGTILSRLALVQVLAHVQRRSLDEVVRDTFAHDQRVEAILRSATPVADTTTAGWAKELVRQDVQGFIEAMQPLSAYAALSSRGFVVNFGDAGSISVPYRGGTNTDVAGAFVGENGVIPVKRTTIGANVLNRYKMAVITTLTKELARTSTPQAETLLRRFMQEDTAVALDKAFLDNAAAVAGVRPPGILNGVAPIAASAAPGAVDKAIADLKALINALIAAGNGVRPVFLMNPAQKLALGLLYSGGVFLFRDELAGGRLMGVEVVASANVALGDVILVDAANFATGLGSPEFDASDTATLVMANADGVAPTQATLAGDRTALGTAEQVPPDGGISVRDTAQLAAGKVGEGSVAISMFQQWAIALRTVLPISWGTTRPGTVQVIHGVGW